MMFDIVFIITAILEIVITCFVAIKLEQAQKKVKNLESKMMLNYRVFTKINAKLKKGIENLNKFIAFFTNKRVILIKNIITSLYTIYEVYMLINALKTLKSYKGLKFFSSKTFKNIVIAKTIYRLLSKLA